MCHYNSSDKKSVTFRSPGAKAELTEVSSIYVLLGKQEVPNPFGYRTFLLISLSSMSITEGVLSAAL